MEYKIFSGRSHPEFATQIAKKIGQTLGKIQIKDFSCGETFVQFDETVRGKDVFLVQTGRTGQMNGDLIELLLMINAARKSFARSVHVIIPAFPYSRQDKIHGPREGISAKLFADLLVGSGMGHLITLQLHSDQIQGFFDCPVDNLNPRRILTQYFLAKKIKNGVVVSPDAGGAKNAKKFADELGLPLAILHKYRPEHNAAEISHVIGDISGKTPIIFDDMIDTAGSVCAAKKALLGAGSAPEVFLAAVHPIFSEPAVERLSEADFNEIVCTDSLPVPTPPKNFHQISAAPLFAEVVKNVAEHKPVSQLYY